LQISHLFNANIQSLKAAENILLNLHDEQYRAVVHPYTANIGKHLRHITDHYQLLFDGLASDGPNPGCIDYDQRKRVEIEEHNRSAMILRLRQICGELQLISANTDKDRTLLISLAVDEGIEAPTVPSSLSRELVFLQSHTVHHYAIIAAVLKLQNIEVDEEFGIAPSTLKYEHQQKCAP